MEAKATMNEEEETGLLNIRDLITRFLNKEEGNLEIRSYLTRAAKDDNTLLTFLRGRKYREEYAWQTLKRHSEVRLRDYPELFPDKLSDTVISHARQRNLVGVLKARDQCGRHVIVFNCGAWDPAFCSLADLLTIYIKLMELLLNDESFVRNGFTYIQQCAGTEMKHARQYTLSSIKRLINVFWHSFPIQLKGIIYVNVPTFLHYTFTIGRIFFPKKLKERLIISPSSAGFDEIHQVIPREKLPEFLGGTLSFNDSMDEKILNMLYNP